MNRGFFRSLEYLGLKMNSATNTKQSIITAANSYECVTQKVKEIEEKSLKEINDEKFENIHFNPNDVEAIVLKNTKNRTVVNDKFKEELEKGGEIASTKTKDEEER